MAAAIYAPIRANSREGLPQSAAPVLNEKNNLAISTSSTTPPPQTTSTQDRKRAWEEVISDDKPRLYNVQVAPNSARPRTPAQPHQHYGAPPPYSQTYTPHFQPQSQPQQQQLFHRHQEQGHQQPQERQQSQPQHMPLRPGDQPPPPPLSQQTPALPGPENQTILPPLRDIVRRHTGAAPLSPLMTASPITTSFGTLPRGSVDNSPYSSTPNYDPRYQQWPDRRLSHHTQTLSPSRSGHAGPQLANHPVEFHGKSAPEQHRHPSFHSHFQPMQPAHQQRQQQGHGSYGPEVHRTSLSVHPVQPLYGSVDQPQSVGTQQPIAAAAQTNPLGPRSQQTSFETRTGFSYPPVDEPYPMSSSSWLSNAPESTPQTNTSPTSTRVPFTPTQPPMGHNDVQKINEARRGVQVTSPHNNRFGGGVQTGLGKFDIKLQLNQVKTSSAELDRFADFYLNHLPESSNPEQDKAMPPLEDLPTTITLDGLLHAHGQTYRALETLRMAVAQAEAYQKSQMAAAQANAEKQAIQQADAAPEAGAGPSSATLGSDVKKRRGRHFEGGQCHSCHVSDTPEWRKGPDGARTLCNACGLHYAKVMRKAANDKKEADSQSESHPQTQIEYSWNNRVSGSTASSSGAPMPPPLSRSDTSAATLVSVPSTDGNNTSNKMADVVPTGSLDLNRL